MGNVHRLPTNDKDWQIYKEDQYLAKIKAIPKLSEDEERHLLRRWQKFKAEKAMQRVVEANLRLVPPISKSTVKRFCFYGPDFRSTWFNLIGAGTVGLMQAVRGYNSKRNQPLEHYARRCIRNECIHAAKALRSVVDRPLGVSTPRDLNFELSESGAYSEDAIRPRESQRRRDTWENVIAFRKAGLTLKETAERLGMSTTTVWRREQAYLSESGKTEPGFIPDSSEPRQVILPWILEARCRGLKLKDIANELGCSIPTAHRCVKAAIQEIRT